MPERIDAGAIGCWSKRMLEGGIAIGEPSSANGDVLGEKLC